MPQVPTVVIVEGLSSALQLQAAMAERGIDAKVLDKNKVHLDGEVLLVDDAPLTLKLNLESEGLELPALMLQPERKAWHSCYGPARRR